ncbi:MAG: DUF11 domain-containing protein [Chitinophagaceae bacterium]|nr:DUF11 domain-containing protein [Rubrivivax sp.]
MKLNFWRPLWRLVMLSAMLCGAGQALALQLGIQINPDRVRPSEWMVVHITVTNDSAAPVPNVSLRSTMPAAGVGTVSQTLFSGGASCTFGDCDPNDTVNWTLGLLAPGAGVTVTMVIPTTATVADGTLISVPATVLVGGVAQASVAQSVTVDGDNALSLSVDTDKDGAQPGGRLTYTLSYANRAASATTGTVLTLPLPPGTSFVSATGGGTLGSGAVSWSLGTLQSGQSGRRQVVVEVGAGIPSGALLPINGATIAGASAVTGPELARATVITRVQANPVLALAYSINADPVRPGEYLRPALTVSNTSDATVFGTVLRARVPVSGVNSISQSLYSGGAFCTFGDCDPLDQALWNIGTLAPGQSVTFSLPAVVAAGFGSGRLIVHEATVVADGVPMMLARHTVASDADHALTLALDADKDSVAPGEALIYTLSYGNRSGSATSGTSLSLPLPPGVGFISASDGGTFSDGMVSWALGTLQAGQSSRRQVRVTVAKSALSGSLLSVNAAQLTGTSAVTGLEVARGSRVTRVESNPVLGLAYAVNADPVRPGEVQRHHLTVTNRSDATVFGTVLRMRMPTEGVNSIGASTATLGVLCSFGDCDPPEYAVWNLGTLAPAAAVTVSLPAPASPGFASGRLIVHEAEATADGVPMVLARHTVLVDVDHLLSLAVDADKETVSPGEPLTYTLTYSNRAATSTTGTTLSFPLPDGATLVGASGGTLSGRTVTWNLGTLLAGTGGIRTVTVVPTADIPQRRFVVNAATLTGTSPVTGIEQARATRVVRIMANHPLRLTVKLSHNPVAPGQTTTATLRLSNTGPAPLVGTRVFVRVPTEGVSAVSQGALSPGATCSFGDCDPFELAVWNPGTVQPGTTRSFTIPLPVLAAFGQGRFVTVDAVASDGSGNVPVATATALVAPPGPDSDADGTPDAFDNCWATANADQTDTDGDGFGNACDADFDNNGNVNVADLAAFKAAFGTTNLLFDLDGNGVVNIADLARFKLRFGQPPGPSGLRP